MLFEYEMVCDDIENCLEGTDTLFGFLQRHLASIYT